MSGDHVHECPRCGGYWPCDDFNCELEQGSPCGECIAEEEEIVRQAELEEKCWKEIDDMEEEKDEEEEDEVIP